MQDFLITAAFRKKIKFFSVVFPNMVILNAYQPPFFSIFVLHLGQGRASEAMAFSFSESSPPEFLTRQSLNMVQLLSAGQSRGLSDWHGGTIYGNNSVRFQTKKQLFNAK
jgi:hypothetical protein